MMDCSTNQCIGLPKKKDNAEMFDIKPLLELLHVNNDINVQVRLLATLAAYIMTNEESRDVIITYNSLYDKICGILSNCPLRRAAVTFNFLSALLITVDEDSSRRKSLIVYAKNMIRSSGCLATMCDLFTSCMMHQDVWRSLCRCLAETCRGVETNQSYCTHLVPMCIQRCSQRNTEVFSVLQSLLQNHARNISLFIESNGITLFHREFLQHDDCLQLLSIVVQSSSEVARRINQSDVSQHMRDFLRVYGPETHLGQWATIILYYLSEGSPNIISGGNQSNANRPKDKTITKSIEGCDNMQSSTDTTRLLQNVMKEIIHCGVPGDLKYLQGLFPPPPVNSESNKSTQPVLIKNQQQTPEICTSNQNISFKFNLPSRHPEKNFLIRNESVQPIKRHNSSFSFLQNVNNKRNSNITSNDDTAVKETELLQKSLHTNEIPSFESTGTDINESIRTMPIIRQKTPEMYDFKPKFASTPKKSNLIGKKKINRELSHNITRRSVQHSFKNCETKRKVQKKRIPKRLQQSKTKTENKHRSISGWFFETINESCTTLVQTVRNIFRPANSEDTQDKTLTAISDKDSSSCSFSFTNYMRKRDAILTKECTKKSRFGFDEFSMEMSNSCHTCNDTVVLKQKLASDEYLKQTVRKLKLGINLYGCDFKKISKQLWPQQTYMTPVVLYNLYRKLIIK